MTVSSIDRSHLSGTPQGVSPVSTDPHVTYLLRLGDDNLVLAQRLGAWISKGPDLEEDIALGNIGLDHLGVARFLLSRAGELEGAGRDEDAVAMGRSETEFLNLLLCEQPNGDFAQTIARQFFIDAYQVPLWEALSSSADAELAGIAQKAVKESRYHLRHSSAWVVRLGDGTDESHLRMQDAIDRLWRFTAEPFVGDHIDSAVTETGVGTDPAALGPAWQAVVHAVIEEATLQIPEDPYARVGGRVGYHTEHLGHLLGEMQWMQKTYQGMAW